MVMSKLLLFVAFQADFLLRLWFDVSIAEHFEGLALPSAGAADIPRPYLVPAISGLFHTHFFPSFLLPSFVHILSRAHEFDLSRYCNDQDHQFEMVRTFHSLIVHSVWRQLSQAMAYINGICSSLAGRGYTQRHMSRPKT